MKRPILFITVLTFFLSACDHQGVMSDDSRSAEAPTLRLRAHPRKAAPAVRHTIKNPEKEGPQVNPYFEQFNERLADEGLGIALRKAEYVTVKGAEQAGQTVYANDRQMRLGTRWVPGDERREPGLDGNNITYLVFEPFSRANIHTDEDTSPDLEGVDAEPAIDASFDTWDSGTQCSNLSLVKQPDDGTFPSAIFTGGSPFVADIVELGFLPGSYFEQVLGPGSSEVTLGVTFTFVFIGEDGNPTDVNNDGYDDTALKEVWYNDDFNWKTDPDAPGIDIETVALHENGHALEQGHFGKVSITGANGKLHVAPRAVMNALVLGTQRDLLGTDNGGHCSLFGAWPNQ